VPVDEIAALELAVAIGELDAMDRAAAPFPQARRAASAGLATSVSSALNAILPSMFALNMVVVGNADRHLVVTIVVGMDADARMPGRFGLGRGLLFLRRWCRSWRPARHSRSADCSG
jgi:hypothetical protein